MRWYAVLANAEASVSEVCASGRGVGQMRLWQGPNQGQAGFAAVDALVAVTILSSSLALSLTAAQIGARASRTADETRDAELLLRSRLESTSDQTGLWRGHDNALAWQVEAHLSGTDSAVPAGPCVRTSTAKAANGRSYRIVTVDTCLSKTAR